VTPIRTASHVTSSTRSSPGTGRPRFRLATEADWPLIWPFWQQIVAAGDTYCYDPTTGYEAGRRMWFGSPPDQVWLVTDGGPADQPAGGTEPGTVLGSYRLGPNKAGPGSHVGSASYMVSSAARGLGIGRAMVLHCLEQASAAGYRGIQFNAVAASNVHAVKLYLDLGFSVIGTVPGGFRHPEQGFVDLLIMYRQL
jgi:GNAT superfamily N-acetyltransferase